MIRLDTLRAAVDEFLTAALVGDGFAPALAQLTQADGVSSAVLSLDDGFNIKDAISTALIAEGVSKNLAGESPPNPRTFRCVPGLHEGFRTDLDDFSQEELARSPWYQEFLRPHGVFWNATATVLRGRWGEGLYISLKRPWSVGPFEQSDLAAFKRVLPDLQRAARLGQRVREFETLGMVKLIHERGDPVFELDIFGRVLRVHAFDDRAVPSVSVARGRLKAGDQLAQPALDRAIAKSLRPPGATSVARLPAGPGESHYLLLVPVLGRARDMFLTASCIAVLIKGPPQPTPLMLSASALRDLFGLTDREAALALRLADGVTLEAAARGLKMAIGTARNHLKNVFEKTGTKRQAELVALLGVLRP